MRECSDGGISPWLIQAGFVIAIGVAALPAPVRADEGGISLWLPGQFGSLAAVPGWAMAEVYYHTTLSASGAVAAARQIEVGRFPATVNVNLNANHLPWWVSA